MKPQPVQLGKHLEGAPIPEIKTAPSKVIDFPQIPHYTSDKESLRDCFSKYCDSSEIDLPPSSKIDFGALLLSKSNTVLLDAAKKEEWDVVQRLLETPRRIEKREIVENISKERLSSEGQPERETLDYELEGSFHNNILTLLDHFSEEIKESKLPKILLEIVTDSKTWNSLMKFCSNDIEIQDKLLSSVFSTVKNSSWEEIDKEMRYALAETLIIRGAPEAIVASIEDFIPKDDQERRFKLSQALINEGNVKTVFNHLDDFGVDSWSSDKWEKCLEAVKNHRSGVEFVAKIPQGLYNEKITALSKICKETLEALNKVTGHIWTAVGRIQDSDSRGYLYQFKPKTAMDSYDSVKEVEIEIYPAVEPVPSHLSSSYKPLSFAELGFKDIEGNKQEGSVSGNSTFIILPDTVVLKHRYNRLKEEKGLPEFSILLSKGIMPDDEFFKAQQKYDAIVSDGKEFIHDMTAHVLPTLSAIINKTDEYKIYKERWTSVLREGREMLDSYYVEEKKIVNERNKSDKPFEKLDDEKEERIRFYEQLLHMLSFATDNLSANDLRLPFEIEETYLVDFVENYVSESEISKGWLERTFKDKGGGRIPSEELIDAWWDVERAARFDDDSDDD